jgi:hypothetical protein
MRRGKLGQFGDCSNGQFWSSLGYWLMRGILQQEMDRMDIYHKFFSVARREALHSTPFTPNYDIGPRILDLGTGTGIWAIDMAE